MSRLLGRVRHLDKRAERRVVAAIAAAERGHRGEIQVVLERRYRGDGPLSRARALFAELGLDATAHGTGVLLYVAVDDRRAAVWAGPGVAGANGPEVWRDVVALVARGFAEGDPAGGLEAALARIGALLVAAAPGDDTRGNELPDRIVQR